jgi:diacylglycerol kinase (ATP)
VTLFKNVTKMTVIRHIKKLFSGKFTHLPFVQTHHGKSVSIISSTQDQSYLETDGESLGHTPFTIEIIPKSLKIITGKKWQEENNLNA